KATGSVPIVFAGVTDPVGGGLVVSLARPGGNTTGFITSEFGFAGKWLELLKEIAPRGTRAAVMRDPAISAGIGLFGAIQSVAPSLGVELRPIDTRDAGEIERAVVAFAREPNGGLIAPTGARVSLHRELIVALAARHRLPAVYGYRSHVMSGGLISYSSDEVDRFRRAAGYIDRILKGEKPADLPVQAPTKYELGVNPKTAKALGLAVPPMLLARADEVMNEKTRVHHAARRCGGMAARGAGAAAGDAGGRLPQRRIARGTSASCGCVPPRPEGGRLRRG